MREEATALDTMKAAGVGRGGGRAAGWGAKRGETAGPAGLAGPPWCSPFPVRSTAKIKQVPGTSCGFLCSSLRQRCRATPPASQGPVVCSSVSRSSFCSASASPPCAAHAACRAREAPQAGCSQQRCAGAGRRTCVLCVHVHRAAAAGGRAALLAFSSAQLQPTDARMSAASTASYLSSASGGLARRSFSSCCSPAPSRGGGLARVGARGRHAMRRSVSTGRRAAAASACRHESRCPWGLTHPATGAALCAQPQTRACDEVGPLAFQCLVPLHIPFNLLRQVLAGPSHLHESAQRRRLEGSGAAAGALGACLLHAAAVRHAAQLQVWRHAGTPSPRLRQ